MKKYILILAVLFSSACSLFAQNSLSLNMGYGYYAGNSENSAPITNGQKFRYTHSIWFDAGLRKLDNYYQEFTTAQVTLGVGYSF